MPRLKEGQRPMAHPKLRGKLENWQQAMASASTGDLSRKSELEPEFRNRTGSRSGKQTPPVPTDGDDGQQKTSGDYGIWGIFLCFRSLF
jgi:hypothetical protein